MSNQMRDDWNDRARRNARFYIASATEDSEAAFDASGERDVELFFAGLDDLLTPAKAVLDIGCGIGRMDRFIAPRVGKLIGVDVSGVMVEKARARLADVPNVEFLEGDGLHLPVPDSQIDVVFSHIVFQHMPRAAARSYFAEAKRVLKTGGEFVFQVPERVAGGPVEPPDSDTFEMRFYEAEQLIEELSGIGFELLDVRRHPVESPKLSFNQMRLRFRNPAVR